MNDESFQTVLAPPRQPLLGYLGCSVFVHLGSLLSVYGFMSLYAMAMLYVPACQKPAPFEPVSIEVSVVSLPKRLNVPDRAARVKRAEGEMAPLKEPPPVKESELKIHKEVPEPKPGNTEEARRQEILDKIERQRMLEHLEAAEGTRDRNPTDPEGTAEDLELAVLGAQARGDPELARWTAAVRALMQRQFRPVTQGATNLKCEVKVRLDPATGRVESAEIVKTSGSPGFDGAAERAPYDVGTVPPAPEKYRPLIAKEGVRIEFVPPT